MKSILLSSILSVALLANSLVAEACVGDTVKVQTFTFNNNGRNGIFAFPSDTSQKYEKIIMQYSLRCKNGYISDQTNRSKGCGEWDYNCYTYLVDSAVVDSFKNSRPSHDIFNFSGNVFRYTNTQQNNYIKYTQKYTTINSITSANTASVGLNTDTLKWLGGVEKCSKIQLLFKASELSSAGLTAGNIQSLWLDVGALGDEVQQVKIKMLDTSLTSLSAASPVFKGLQEVYFLNTTFSGTGIQKLNFNTPFAWDGLANIVIEISYTNHTSSIVNGITAADAGFNSAIIAKENDYCLSFSGNSGQVVDLGKNITITGANPRTIEGWAYAKGFNDGGIWDAGAKGTNGGDFSFRTINGNKDSWRVQTWGSTDMDVTLPGSQGAWHHYAMVYDGTTIMLYYDGVLKGSKTAALNTLSDVFRLGTWSGTTFDGSIDDIRVWDTVLSPATIKNWMNRKLSPTHPNYSHLKAYYAMDENQGTILTDATNQFPGTIYNNPAWNLFHGSNMFKRFTESTVRPAITFAQGNYSISNKDSINYDTIPLKASRVIAYQLAGNDIAVKDTTYKIAAGGYTYTYSESGTKLDSVKIIAQDSIIITQLNYYSKVPSRIELINFITPYGIGLDLNGLNGKTWEFDVTDYLPVLKGNKFLSIEGGNYQEDMDIRFLFIKGIPPRNVKDIRQIWPSGATRTAGYGEIATDGQFEPRNIILDPSAKAFKIRSQISGHGQDGEFTSREHYLTVNPGSHKEAWNVWRTCGENPIYPQGGTWTLDRAGWCPGKVVDFKETEITPWVTPGANVTLDYGITDPYPGGGDWNYRVNNQLVTYGAPNFNVDAAIDYIKNPSTRVEFARQNPMCDNPIVAIKNTGKNSITSLEITYGLNGTTKSVYNWNGTLNFLETTEIALPLIDWSGAQSTQFEAEITKVNGQSDEYADNNKANSSYSAVPVSPRKFVIEFRTNNAASEDRYVLRQINTGTNIINKNNLTNNTIYRDTVDLPAGCYSFELNDDGPIVGYFNKDGISYWFNTQNGYETAGSLYFRDAVIKNKILKNFNGDFGAYIYYQFTVTSGVGVNTIQYEQADKLLVYPNPSKGVFNIEIQTANENAKTQADVYDYTGKNIYSKSFDGGSTETSINLNAFAKGVYMLRININGHLISRKLLIE